MVAALCCLGRLCTFHGVPWMPSGIPEGLHDTCTPPPCTEDLHQQNKGLKIQGIEHQSGEITISSRDW